MEKLDLNALGVEELSNDVMGSITGGDKADFALAVASGIGLAMIGIGLIASGPVGVAVGIMGESLDVSTTVAGIVKGLFD